MYRPVTAFVCSLILIPLAAVSLSAQPEKEGVPVKSVHPQGTSLTKKRSAAGRIGVSADLSRMDFVDLNNLGTRLTAEDRYSEAIRVFGLALKLDPEASAAHVNLSITHERDGNLPEALNSAEAAVELAPNDKRALLQLCGIYYLMKRFDRASDCYEKLAVIAPADPSVRAQLGASLIRNGQSEKAIEILKQVVFETPLYARAHNSIGFAYFRLKKYGRAAGYFKRAVEIDPGSALFRFNLGITQALQNNKPGAISQYKILKEIDPERARKVYQVIYRNQVVQAGPQEK